MNQISRTFTGIEVKSLTEASKIASELLEMLHAGTHTYGKPFSSSTASAFILILAGLDPVVTIAEIRWHVVNLLEEDANFPSAAQLRDRILLKRHRDESEARMIQESERIRREDQAESDRVSIEKYGTTTPTPEQIRERLEKNPGAANLLRNVLNGIPMDDDPFPGE